MIDPHKHVNYALGMILGVDDFQQEFAYLANRDQWLARDLLGSGIVHGLELSLDEGEGRGPKLQVSPGVAISPTGMLIALHKTGVVCLEDWLASPRVQAGLKELFVERTQGIAEAYIRLRYQESLGEVIPLAGTPTNPEDGLHPSRIIDGFQLELSLEPPEGDWLSLGVVKLPLSGVEQDWQIDSEKRIHLSEMGRTQIIPLGRLQELLFSNKRDREGGKAFHNPALVEKPAACGSYAVLAAGVVEFSANPLNVKVLSSYNGLRLLGRAAKITKTHLQIRLTFDGYMRPADDSPGEMIVKLTPWMEDGLCAAVFAGFTNKGFAVNVAPVVGDLKGLKGKLMLEVSQYEGDSH